MCTVNAAKAYGLASLGSISPGKWADVIVVRPSFVATPYSGSVYSYVVNALRGPDVRDVVVDGGAVVRDGKVLTVDVAKSEKQVLKTMERLWRRLGTSPPEAVEPVRSESRTFGRKRPRGRV
jgi:cytosine/adenosine deaminase-related metal-dependent hydrolase